MKRLVLGIIAATAMTLPALAADIKPAVIYDMGGKFDKSFNEAAYHGAEKFKKETGIAYRDFEISNDTQREQALEKFAEDGNSPIVAIGFSFEQAIMKVAPQYPDTQFAIIDDLIDVAKVPNVRSIVYKEHEGSYLVGIMAAMASKTGTVGFVGGMDIPLIHKFDCGYVGGVKATNKDAKVIENYTGSTPAAWNDPAKGGEIAKAQMDQGADVVYAAAGGTGVGVLQAAADAGKLAIGVDSNQNGLQPGHVLTSMVKHTDAAVYDAFMDAKNGKFTFGPRSLGLAEDAVGYAMDENNKSLVTPEMLKAVEQAKADIISGKIKVHDFMSDNACPY
jgi:basic membrane protein A